MDKIPVKHLERLLFLMGADKNAPVELIEHFFLRYLIGKPLPIMDFEFPFSPMLVYLSCTTDE
ncbi:MAG: hypothetical protein K2X48_16595 [Chitinophagaceae bacterium]|nr:hypothetical protein [Chitinophagaceae bacterium]